MQWVSSVIDNIWCWPVPGKGELKSWIIMPMSQMLKHGVYLGFHWLNTNGCEISLLAKWNSMDRLHHQSNAQWNVFTFVWGLAIRRISMSRMLNSSTLTWRMNLRKIWSNRGSVILFMNRFKYEVVAITSSTPLVPYSTTCEFKKNKQINWRTQQGIP